MQKQTSKLYKSWFFVTFIILKPKKKKIVEEIMEGWHTTQLNILDKSDNIDL